MIYIYKHETADEVDVIEREFPIGTAPSTVKEGGRTYRRVYTPPQPVFYGPDFFHTESSKSPLMRIPRKQRI